MLCIGALSVSYTHLDVYKRQGLLRGTNIGGLGTPVASLASLITLKYYFRCV